MTHKSSLHSSPQEAVQAPPEEFLYVACLHEGTGVDAPDFLAVVDAEDGSIIHETPMPNVGDELHHYGWNRCSSACHGPDRSHLIVPGFRSSRVHIVGVEDDPRKPTIEKVIEPEELIAQHRFRRGESDMRKTAVHSLSLLCAMTLVTVAATAPTTLAASPHYKVEFLPVPEGCQSYSLFHGLDSRDRVAGVFTCDGLVTQRAAIWDRGVLIELGTFGGPSSVPIGLSQQGQVVGSAETSEIYEDGSHVSRPFLWSDGLMQDLGTLGGQIGGAASINSRGTIVGACQALSLDTRINRRPLRACLWGEGTVQDLGDLGRSLFFRVSKFRILVKMPPQVDQPIVERGQEGIQHEKNLLK
jgi:probable HAF family extracellular repeat protein